MARTLPEPRQRLLDAGLKLFADGGYAGTSVQQITDEAKVTKPTLYYYFHSKGGLFQALVDLAMDERLRLMGQAAPADKPTVDQLTDIIVSVTSFARRQPDLLRLCFSIAFAAPGEMPPGLKKSRKMGESYEFVRGIIAAGLERGILNRDFTVDELTQSYFQLVQHATVIALFSARPPRSVPPLRLPTVTEPRRAVELFLTGASSKIKSTRRAASMAKALRAVALAALVSCTAHGQSIAQNPPTDPGVSTNVVPTSPASAMTNAAPVEMPATGPTTEEVRPVPLAVRASHPELATVSPIEANAHDPRALDLQTCFQLTAIRDDSLKISMQDIAIAQAQLSQSLAALWPTFTATNQQQFLHYTGNSSGSSFSNLSTTSLGAAGGGSGSVGTPVTGLTEVTNNRNYTSQSNITMSYTLFNGGQNYNTVGASRALVAARREALARDYQTIYQDVAQAFYNVLEFQGDMIIQHDLVEALSARVDDLKDRVRLGRSRPSEFLQAQTDLANARFTTEQQLGSSNAAEETLAFYIGIPAGKFKLKDAQKFPTAGQLESYLQHSGARPDVLSQVQSLRQAERNLSVAQGELFPTITANGDYLASQDPVSNDVDGTMTLQISLPIFDGGLILGQIHQNREMVRQSALNVEQLQRTADQDTRTAYVNFNASVAQVLVLREAARLAAANFQAQVEDYRRGVVSNLDVLTALQDYQTARVQLHNANMTARLDLINLHVAAGIAATGSNVDNRALPTTFGHAP